MLPDATAALAVAPDVAAQNDEDAGGRAVSLRLAGHVERRGDLFVGGGEWLGDPNGTARIEGFSLQWPKRPANVDIAYGCALLGLGRMPDVIVGEYVGTRMKARAINGITFSLIGADAEKYSSSSRRGSATGRISARSWRRSTCADRRGASTWSPCAYSSPRVTARKPASVEAPRVATTVSPWPLARSTQARPDFRAPRVAAAM